MLPLIYLPIGPRRINLIDIKMRGLRIKSFGKLGIQIWDNIKMKMQAYKSVGKVWLIFMTIN